MGRRNNNKRQKRSCNKSTEALHEDKDRISDLPDEILFHILSFLSTMDVVKTGVLSRRWEHLWTNVQTFWFCGPSRFDEEEIGKFVSSVTQTLFFIESNNIQRFTLKDCVLSARSPKSMNEKEAKRTKELCLHVDKWIRLLVRKNVEGLNLCFSGGCKYQGSVGCCYKLPCHLLFNDTIKSLYLNTCIIDAVRPIQWRSLTKLHLHNIVLSDQLIQNILNGSPLLNLLSLIYCKGISNLSITSSNLRKLHLCISRTSSMVKLSVPNVQTLACIGDIAKYNVIDVSSLVNVRVGYFLGKIDSSYQTIVKRFLENIRNARSFEISTCCIQIADFQHKNIAHCKAKCNMLQQWSFTLSRPTVLV
ncbi:hypothetical protein AQUCO_07600145v1 [Aquilegia coerulea]|uniref:F-box domain-containing protein n=1 Tax=Aquilegia coerulea TaxID=218851 RepID=A0A2G5CA96_AQUCA|nr:hypothetical protein AQUCO_07600145v1 [Aquilegia coerulea]